MIRATQRTQTNSPLRVPLGPEHHVANISHAFPMLNGNVAFLANWAN